MSPAEQQPDGCPLSQAGLAALARLLKDHVQRFPIEPGDAPTGRGKSWTTAMSVKCKSDGSKI